VFGCVICWVGSRLDCALGDFGVASIHIQGIKTPHTLDAFWFFKRDPTCNAVTLTAFSFRAGGGLSQDEAKVLKSIASTHDIHFKIPRIISIEDRLNKVRLTVCNVEKDAVIFQHPADLFAISIHRNFTHSRFIQPLTSLRYLPLFSITSSGGLHGLP
jgi:hypothetical protein